MRQSTKSVLSLAAAGILLYLSFRRLDPREIGASISGASPALLVLSVALNLSHYLFRALRWRSFLHHFRAGIGMVSLLSAIFVGYLVTWVFPGRLGEFVRPFLLGRREGIPASGAFSTVVLERIFDLGAVVGLFGIALLLVPSSLLVQSATGPMATIVRSGRMLGVGTLITLPVLLGLFLYRDRLFGFLEGRPGESGCPWLPPVIRWGRSFTEGFGILATPGRLLVAVGHSLAAWILIGLSTWLVLEAFHLDVPPLAAFLFLPLPVLGIAVPTPGGLGSFEYFCQWGLRNLFGSPAHEAMAASVSLHVVSLFPVLLLGPVAVWKEGISLRGILRESRRRLDGLPPGGDVP